MADARGKLTLQNDANSLFERGSASCVGKCACTEGGEVCIYCHRESPREIHGHRHASAQILIAPGQAECEATWVDQCGNRIHRKIRGGEIWVVPSGTEHSLRWLSEATLIILHLNPDWADQLARGVVAQVRVELLKACVVIDPLVGPLVAELERIQGTDSPVMLMQMVALGHCLAARLLLAFSLRPSSEAVVLRHQLGDERLTRVVSFIESHCSERITQAMLAREARLSAGHFGVLFKATTGLTPEQFVLRARLLRAKPLIESGNYTVSQVAHMTGFSDHSHFTFQFKRLFGTPPRAFLPVLRKA